MSIPESVEDTIMDCDNMGIDLRLEYMNKTKPTIIQFQAKPDREYKDLVQPVLGYLYDIINHNEIGGDDNTTFDAKGEVIKPTDILNIEIVEYLIFNES